MKKSKTFSVSKISKAILHLCCMGSIMVYPAMADVPGPGNTAVHMKKAVPVWVAGREKEMNLTLGFRGVFTASKNRNYILSITASTLYRVSLNGQFLGYGPARAGHGYFRMDTYDLSDMLRDGENVVAIEVAGYNVNSFYTLDQPSFLQAEVISGEEVLLATGSNTGFEAFQIREKLQKVERYSFQRPFTEFYRLTPGYDQWKKDPDISIERLRLIRLAPVRLLGRCLLMPSFQKIAPVSVYAQGKFQLIKKEKYYQDRSLVNIGTKLKGYTMDQLEVFPSVVVQEMSTVSQDIIAKSYSSGIVTNLSEGDYYSFNFGNNLSGFIGVTISCSEPSTIYCCFDEILVDGDVNSKKHMPDVNNQVVFELQPGEYELESFEPYTFKYLKMMAVKGNCHIHKVYLREYAYPRNEKAYFSSDNDKLNEIFKAAEQTFRQNAVDVLTDCPSRERAGWLCDSYFSAVMEQEFTGNTAIARNFYENYALPEKFAHLPDGMIPMCYPADHNDSVFIPNWSLWFIIQVNDFIKRGGDPAIAVMLKPRIEKLLDYFARFENKDGLLESLKSWIFVEWSRANSFVRDVSYPTNMLYSAALSSAAGLYQNDSWKEKSEYIRKTILAQSYNGAFFVDNAIRDKTGKLTVTANTTEVCQYYAFFFKIATPESHPELWEKLIHEFGPDRDDKQVYPNVYRANAFIGNYLRMDILSRNNLKNQVANEVQDYFYHMAALTGTLWEHMGTQASCNHGFASYVAHILYRDILGIHSIDYLNHEVIVRFNDLDVLECQGAIPVGDEKIELKWKRSGNKIRYSVKTPVDYQLAIENFSTADLVHVEDL